MLVSLENSVSSHDSLVLIQTLAFLKLLIVYNKVDGVIHKKIVLMDQRMQKNRFMARVTCD